MNKEQIVTILREYKGKTLLKFWPYGYEYPIELPVITSGSRKKTGAWTWNGNLEKPTLKPSIKTIDGETKKIIHIWLTDGMCYYINDSINELAGRKVPLNLLNNYNQK